MIIKFFLLYIFFISCSSIDFYIQKPLVLDAGKTDSKLLILINDDEIIKENTFPEIYLFVYVNDSLIAKAKKNLNNTDNYNNKFYGSFKEDINVLHGLKNLKIVYRTYRNNEQTDLIFKEKVEFSPNKVTEISFNKNFNLKYIDN